MGDFIDNSFKMNLCTDLSSARNTLQQFTKITYYSQKEIWMTSCPVPCQQTVFKVKFSQFHLNNRLDFADESSKDILKNYVTLSLGFESFAIEEREENLVYDAGSFLAAGLLYI
jgi:hypothetical protein